MKTPHPRTWLWLSALVVILDQVTKALAELYLQPYPPLQLLPFFDLRLAYNTGAAFSFLNDAGGWQRVFFILLTTVVLAVLVRWLLHLKGGQRLLPAGLSLVIGGAIGNLIDRVATGAVVDFLDFHYAGWHWPAFNIADSAITVGVVLLVVDALLSSGKRNVDQG